MADRKSPFISEAIACVIPQPGHLMPKIILNRQKSEFVK